MALSPLLRAFLQAGQMRFRGASEEDFGTDADVSKEVEKLTGIRVLRERGCGKLSEEAGQKGWSLRGLVLDVDVCVALDEGVSDGTQKEGRTGFAAF